ncbi:MAG: S1/P1 nuclease [Proteobacteria bacterium]|nr:S1/P1 nuclease [Pseudomonadota bacterium]
MKIIVKYLLTGLMLLSVCPNVYAYNAAGHEISAMITWDLLSSDKRQKIAKIIQQHAMYKQDFEISRKPGGNEMKWAFARASSWPDAPRDTRYYNKSLQAKYNRSSWHYNPAAIIPKKHKGHYKFNRKVKKQLKRIKKSHKIYLVEALQQNIALIKDDKTTGSDKALALTWVFHLISDLHQPLHSASLYTPRHFPKGDRGGNSIPSKADTNAKTRDLHNYWDWILSSRTSFKHNALIAKKLAKKHASQGEKASKDMHIKNWLLESQQLAEKYAYSDLVIDWLNKNSQSNKDIPPVILNRKYWQQAKDVSEVQVVKSAYRLAKLLDQIFD